jgi:hypothetical protein
MFSSSPPHARRYPMADRLKVVDKVENPAAHFKKPKKVVQDKALSHDEKKHLTLGSRTSDSY